MTPTADRTIIVKINEVKEAHAAQRQAFELLKQAEANRDDAAEIATATKALKKAQKEAKKARKILDKAIKANAKALRKKLFNN